MNEYSDKLNILFDHLSNKMSEVRNCMADIIEQQEDVKADKLADFTTEALLDEVRIRLGNA